MKGIQSFGFLEVGFPTPLPGRKVDLEGLRWSRWPLMVDRCRPFQL